jgi:hypothetical protein
LFYHLWGFLTYLLSMEKMTCHVVIWAGVIPF